MLVFRPQKNLYLNKKCFYFSSTGNNQTVKKISRALCILLLNAAGGAFAQSDSFASVGEIRVTQNAPCQGKTGVRFDILDVTVSGQRGRRLSISFDLQNEGQTVSRSQVVIPPVSVRSNPQNWKQIAWFCYPYDVLAKWAPDASELTGTFHIQSGNQSAQALTVFPTSGNPSPSGPTDPPPPPGVVSSDASVILGEWREPTRQTRENYTWKFLAEGKVTRSWAGFDEGTYTLSGNTLNVQFGSETKIVFKVEGRRMTVQTADGYTSIRPGYIIEKK